MTQQTGESEYAQVEFSYDNSDYVFQANTEDDHLLKLMRHRKSFYETDVLERIRHQLDGKKGAALDVGAYMGTHSIYFARVCGLVPTFAFEPNAQSFSMLVRNLENNQAEQLITPVAVGLGAIEGYGRLVKGDASNAGTTSLQLNETGEIRVSTVDQQVKAAVSTEKIALIKIDVEGRELEVLEGAVETIQQHQPVLCVEVHGDTQFRLFNNFLLSRNYGIVDCLGGSPTYIAQPFTNADWRWRTIGQLWRLRAALRQSLLRGIIRHLCLRIGEGPWQPDSSD